MSRASARIYREAAELILNRTEDYCCYAITARDKYVRTTARADFWDAFVPDNRQSIFWGSMWADNDTDRRNCRVLALLFASAMAESGDL